MDDVEEIVRRLDKRPGFKIVSHCEVGLPVFSVIPLVTLREECQIGVLEETVLRCIRHGVDTSSTISSFLGVPNDVLSAQIGALLYEGVIRQGIDSDSYILSPKGLTRLAELATTNVQKEEFRLFIDGLTRKLIPIEAADLYGSRQLEAAGVPTIAPSPRTSPKASDISVSEINRLFSLLGKDERARRHAVRIEGYTRKTYLLFRRSIAMAFKADTGRGMSIAFAIDGRISDEHELAFSASGSDQRSTIFKDLFDSTKRRNEIAATQRHIQEFVPSALANQKPLGEGRNTLHLPKPATHLPGAVKTLSSYEHPPILRAAIDSAAERLLIVSPWVRHQVVDDSFLNSLRNCIDRGVEVIIAFGFGRKDRGERPEDIQARKQLEALAAKFRNFRLIEKSNIHAKILLVDSKYFVTTSFNWLSFRGDPSQPLREEEGTYVEGAAAVDQYFAKLESRLLDASQ